jgi:ABC-type iron transport system FetAB permease component
MNNSIQLIDFTKLALAFVPVLAVRYQIMVMCMVYSSAGISAACFLMFVKSEKFVNGI